MAWESLENTPAALLSRRTVSGSTGKWDFPGCSKPRRASWTDWRTLELDTPTIFLAVPAARPRSGPRHAPKFTPPGGRTSTVVPMGLDEDIRFQEGDHLTWSARKPAVLPATLSYATALWVGPALLGRMSCFSRLPGAAPGEGVRRGNPGSLCITSRGRFGSLYGTSLDVVTPSSRTIRSLVLLHCI